MIDLHLLQCGLGMPNQVDSGAHPMLYCYQYQCYSRSCGALQAGRVRTVSRSHPRENPRYSEGKVAWSDFGLAKYSLDYHLDGHLHFDPSSTKLDLPRAIPYRLQWRQLHGWHSSNQHPGPVGHILDHLLLTLQYLENFVNLANFQFYSPVLDRQLLPNQQRWALPMRCHPMWCRHCWHC
ncbi:MAG: Uncharacterised protein [Marine Group II euryarchaeote MED-G33]|nr:MAG: Uncharacterised protein [Marine Group II euryarchaeote MED-G33]